MPQLLRGLGSVPFDSRGIKSQNLNLIENGYFKNYLLGLRSARQLKLKPNGNSSPYNLTLNNGTVSPDDLIKIEFPACFCIPSLNFFSEVTNKSSPTI